MSRVSWAGLEGDRVKRRLCREQGRIRKKIYRKECEGNHGWRKVLAKRKG